MNTTTASNLTQLLFALWSNPYPTRYATNSNVNAIANKKLNLEQEQVSTGGNKRAQGKQVTRNCPAGETE